MGNLVKVRLSQEVLLTPAVEKALGCFGVPESRELYQLAGTFESTSNLASLTAARFHVVAILKSDKPLVFLDEQITVTLKHSVKIRPTPNPNDLEVYKVSEGFILDGVCFQPSEEVVLRKAPKGMTLLVSGLEVKVRPSFVVKLRTLCTRKRTIQVVYPTANGWCAIRVMAYSLEDAIETLHTQEPYFLTESPIPVGLHSTESMLAHVKSATTPAGLGCASLEAIRRIYVTGAPPGFLEPNDPIFVRWLDMAKVPAEQPSRLEHMRYLAIGHKQFSGNT